MEDNFKLDPETMLGDYNQAWQAFSHYYKKTGDKSPEVIKKFFKDSYIVPLFPSFDPYTGESTNDGSVIYL